MIVEPVKETPFQIRMARGHEMRLGHPLKAVQVSADGTLWHIVRLCCGEAVPESVESWETHIPDRPKP